MTRFVNSYGVGTVSEINYSLNEMSDGNKMEFVLEVKEDAEVVERHYGKAERKESLNIKFEQTDKEYNFSKDVIFPHKFLEDVLDNLESGKKLIVRNVYEGTIPDKYFNISVFFTDEVVSVDKKKLDKGIKNKFRKIRLYPWIIYVIVSVLRTRHKIPIHVVTNMVINLCMKSFSYKIFYYVYVFYFRLLNYHLYSSFSLFRNQMALSKSSMGLPLCS